jgi:sigma-B regulation protein RsbU (phosphoserine phosphatase)
LEVFTQISQELAVEMNLREMLRRVLRLTLDRLSASSGTFVVFNENGDAIEAAMAYNGEVGQYGVQEYHDLVERGLAGWVVKNRQAALISNTRDDPRWLPRPWEEKTSGGRSAISVITLTSGNVATFNEEDLSLLTAVAMFITVVNYAL